MFLNQELTKIQHMFDLENIFPYFYENI